MAYFLPTTGQSISAPGQSANPGMYFIPNPSSQSSLEKYSSAYAKVASASVCLGSLLIICGTISGAGAVMSIAFYAEGRIFGTGFWCGAVFISAGSVAIAAGQHLTDSLIIGTAVTSAFSVIFGFAQIAMAAVFLIYDDNDFLGVGSYYAVVANIMLIGAGSLAVIFGLSLFIVACRIVCSNADQQVAPMPIQVVWLAQQQQQQQPPNGPSQQQQQHSSSSQINQSVNRTDDATSETDETDHKQKTLIKNGREYCNMT